MDNSLDFNPLTILASGEQFCHRRSWRVLWKVRFSNSPHMTMKDQRRIVSCSADTGNFHPCSRFQRKNRTGRESNEYAACRVMDKQCCMSGIDVRIVKRDNSTNSNGIATRCFFKRNIVSFVRRGESTLWSIGCFSRLCCARGACQRV